MKTFNHEPPMKEETEKPSRLPRRSKFDMHQGALEVNAFMTGSAITPHKFGGSPPACQPVDTDESDENSVLLFEMPIDLGT
jgi:hypothetical protein